MKSIEATLNLVSGIVAKIRESYPLDIALAGGYAVISHGVGRTTADADFYLYSDIIQKDSTSFFKILKTAIPANFEVRVIEGSKIPGDPFPYDVVFLTDKTGEFPRIDFIIARYKWELEGIKCAKSLEDIPFPVLPIPYLIATKLRAGGPKDDYDVIELYKFLSKEEKKKTDELAAHIRRDKKLKVLLKPGRAVPEPEDKNQLI